MSDSPERDAIQDHEDLDAETVVDDAKELFDADNEMVPPPQPDTPPPD